MGRPLSLVTVMLILAAGCGPAEAPKPANVIEEPGDRGFADLRKRSEEIGILRIDLVMVEAPEKFAVDPVELPDGTKVDPGFGGG